MKSLLAVVGAGFIAMTMWGPSADAAPRCVWRGSAWQCWNGHSWNHDRGQRAEIRHDRHRLRHLTRRLERDVHTGSTVEARRDLHRLDRTHRELRQDRRDFHNGR